MTETQLEIVCQQSTDSSGKFELVHSNSHSSLEQTDLQQQQQNHLQSNQLPTKATKWFGFTIQNLLNKLREFALQEKASHLNLKNVDDDWEIPFERIRMCHDDFQECGSQGHVFYGKFSNTPVAVKRVKDVSLTKIRHLRDLNHKNVIKFRGISQNANFYFIIMEWCPYGTLDNHLHSGRMMYADSICDFAQQIACGMKYLHSKNIIHRDLKPSNILLTHKDVLKISDFGTHRVFIDKMPVTSTTYAGTHAYMAPEVIRSEPYSFPVDVWSYGVVLWELAITERPFKGLDSSAVVWAVGNNSMRLPVPCDFPEGFKLILNKCWTAQPSERVIFQQISMILKGAASEVEKTPPGRWRQLQDSWRKRVREEFNAQKSLQVKKEPDEDLICKQSRKALAEALEQAQKRLKKNNNLYLRIQETSLLMLRDREELARREESVSKREEAVSEMEAQKANMINEMNQLKDQLNQIHAELARRGIKLDS